MVYWYIVCSAMKCGGGLGGRMSLAKQRSLGILSQIWKVKHLVLMRGQGGGGGLGVGRENVKCKAQKVGYSIIVIIQIARILGISSEVLSISAVSSIFVAVWEWQLPLSPPPPPPWLHPSRVTNNIMMVQLDNLVVVFKL